MTQPGPTGPGARRDPVGELRFRAEIATIAIGYFSECSGLSAEYEITEYHQGGALTPEKLRGAIRYPNLVLKRGVTSEDALMNWFFEAQDPAERPDLTLALLGPDGGVIRQWVFLQAFPVKWHGPGLNAASTGAATESLELAHAGIAVGQSGGGGA